MVLFSGERALRWQRSHEYARCAFALSRGPHASGSEALFDHALNNGLAVIVSTAWPGEELGQPRRRNGSERLEHHVKGAAQLLDVLSVKAADAAGSITPPGVQLAAGRVRVVRIEKSPTPDPEVVTLTVSIFHDGSPSRMMLPLGADNDMFGGADVVRVEVATLREAITIAHPVRHGRQRPGELQQRHVDALLALDHHPRLQRLMDAQWDADYVRDKARDLWLRDNATDYLALLGEDEVQRRVEAADCYGSDLDGRSSQDCPVCGNDTLVPTSIDAFGIGIAVGTCIVCGYWRSPRIVDEQAQDVRWEQVHQYD